MLDVAEKLTTQSEDFSKMLYIFAEKSQRYICFNKKWKLVGLVITLARQLVDIFHYRARSSIFIRVGGRTRIGLGHVYTRRLSRIDADNPR